MNLPSLLAKLSGGVYRVTAACALCVVPLLSSGCGQVNGSTQTQYAQLRVIDTSSSAGGVDIHIGSNVLAYNIGFGSVVNYTPVLPGTYTINVDQASTNMTRSAPSREKCVVFIVFPEQLCASKCRLYNMQNATVLVMVSEYLNDQCILICDV